MPLTPKVQSKMDIPEKLATLGTQDLKNTKTKTNSMNLIHICMYTCNTFDLSRENSYLSSR